MKPPTCRQSIRCLLDVGDLAPTAISQVGMGEFVGDDIVCECLGTVSQPRPEQDATAALAWGARRWHPHCPAAIASVSFKCNRKPLIVEKVSLHHIGEPIEHDEYAVC